MACPANHDEWTFDLNIDARISPPKPARKVNLVFCIQITGNTISGKVFDPNPTPVELSSLTGTRVPIGQSERTFMSLEFTWGEVAIFMAGFTVPSGKGKFHGRFMVSDRDERAVAQEMLSSETGDQETGSVTMLSQPPPDTGDVGTGTGQQT